MGFLAFLFRKSQQLSIIVIVSIVYYPQDTEPLSIFSVHFLQEKVLGPMKTRSILRVRLGEHSTEGPILMETRKIFSSFQLLLSPSARHTRVMFANTKWLWKKVCAWVSWIKTKGFVLLDQQGNQIYNVSSFKCVTDRNFIS